MQVRYTGLFDEVIVPEVSASETVKRGEAIEVQSAVGTGSTFTVRLPARAGAARPVTDDPA